MGGTTTGGKIAAKTNKRIYGQDFYSKIGKIGGSVKNPNKGFGSMPTEKVSAAGKKGGLRSRKKRENIKEYWKSRSSDSVANILSKYK